MAVTAAVVLVFMPNQTSAQQLLQWDRRKGEVGVSFIGTWTGTPNRLSRNVTNRQWFRFPLRGTLLHQRVLDYRLSLAPSFAQRGSTGLPSSLNSREFGVDFSARVLSGLPVSMTVAYNQSAGTTSGGAGSQGDFATHNFVTGVIFRNRFLPARMDYSTRFRENSWISGIDLLPIEWANNTRSLRFSAQSTKLRVAAERVNFDDRLGVSDFAVWNTAVNHRFSWGKGSRLESSYDRSDRRGSGPYRRATWRERLHLQHSLGTSSDWTLHRHSAETGNFGSANTSLSYGLTSRVNRWLSVGLNAGSRVSRFNGSRDRTYSIAPRANTNLRLPASTRMTILGSFGYEQRSRENVGASGIEILNERHEVDETRNFVLDNSDVDQATVVVRSSDEVLIYLRNVDYQIIELGDLFQIVIPPESRIGIGDVVLVTYQFSTSELPSGSLITGRYDISVSRKGITVQHSRSLRESRGGNGEAIFGFGTFDENRFGIRGALRTPLGRLVFDAHRRARRSSAFDFTTYEANSSLALPPLTRLQLALGGSGRKTVNEGQTLKALSGHMTIAWALARQFRVDSRIQAWQIDVVEGASDRSLGFDVNVNAKIWSLVTYIRFEHNKRFIPMPSTVSRFSMRLVRVL